MREPGTRLCHEPNQYPPEWAENEKGWGTVFTDNLDGSFTINLKREWLIKPVFPKSKTQQLIATGNLDPLCGGELSEAPIYPVPIFYQTESDTAIFDDLDYPCVFIPKESDTNKVIFPHDISDDVRNFILKSIAGAAASMSEELIYRAKFEFLMFDSISEKVEDWHSDGLVELAGYTMLSRVITWNARPTKFATVADGKLGFPDVFNIQNVLEACPGGVYLFHKKQPHAVPEFDMNKLVSEQRAKVAEELQKDIPDRSRKIAMLTIYLPEED